MNMDLNENMILKNECLQLNSVWQDVKRMLLVTTVRRFSNV